MAQLFPHNFKGRVFLALVMLLMLWPLGVRAEDRGGGETLRIAVKETVRPLGFRDERGELQGLEIALARRLALELLGDGAAVELIPVKNQDRLALVVSGQVDCAIAQMTQNAARDRLVDFSAPYYLDGVGIVSLNAQWRHPESFQGRRLAVLKDSGTITVVRNALPEAQLVGVASYQDGQTLLRTGQVDGFAGDNSVLAGWTQQDTRYVLTPLAEKVYPLAIALPKGLQHEDFRQKVNQVLLKLRASGWLREQWQRWGLPF